MLISGAEPEFLRKLGVAHNLPERLGVDFLWSIPNASGGGLVGVQRKVYSDLLQSLGDRLTRETAQKRSLKAAFLLIEGDPKWTTNGALLSTYGDSRWTLVHHWGLMASLQLQGWQIITTR